MTCTLSQETTQLLRTAARRVTHLPALEVLVAVAVAWALEVALPVQSVVTGSEDWQSRHLGA
jgi:hypothetical protein